MVLASAPKQASVWGFTTNPGSQSLQSDARVMHFDTHNLPADGATVAELDGALAGVTGAVASASDAASGAVAFFDGAAGELLSL